MDNYAIPKMTCEELNESLDKGESPVVIDTRASSAYRVEHIPGAINIYLNPSGDPFERQLTFMALPADRPLIVYCDCSDESDSLKMAYEIKNQRYEITDISVLLLGINRWKELGYPVEASEF